MKLSFALVSLLSASSLHGATIFAITTPATWETASHWTGGAVSGVIPGTTTGQVDVAGVNNARSLTLNSDAAGAGSISRMNVANQNPGTGTSFFTMTSAASLSTPSFNIGGNGSAGDFTYNDGASLTVTNTLLMGRNTLHNGTDAPASSSVTIALGVGGLSNPISTGTLNLRQVLAGHILNIDASSYTGGAADIDLITFTTHNGGDFDTVNITGLDPTLASSVIYDADSVTLSLTAVPEPSSLALLALGSLGLIRRRR